MTLRMFGLIYSMLRAVLMSLGYEQSNEYMKQCDSAFHDIVRRYGEYD